MSKYLIFNKNNTKYIDTLLTSFNQNIISIKHGLNGLDINNDILLIIDIKMLYLALKLGFKHLYYFNIEQMSIPLDYNNGCELVDIAFLNNRNIHNQYFKIANTLEFINKFKVVDYSTENKYIWENIFNTKISHIIEPIYPLLTDNIDKSLDYISLINHKYRPVYINKYLPNIKNKISNFLGRFNNNRRDILKSAKIMINIHCGENYRIGELFRINEALSHKVIVISQNCYNNELITLKDYIIFVDDDKMEEKCIEVLNNYEKYYEMFFEGNNLSRLRMLMENIKNYNNENISRLV